MQQLEKNAKTKKRVSRGRKRLDDTEDTVYVGCRIPAKYVELLDRAVAQAKLFGFDECDRSKILRALIEYRANNMAMIYDFMAKKNNVR